MKTWILMLALCAGWGVRAQPIDSLLRVVRAADQSTREEVIRQMARQPAEPDSLLAAYARMQQSDRENQQIVFGLLDRQGWPEGLTKEGNETICLVIDHADAPDLKRYLPLVELQAERGTVSRAMYATMLDRMLMHDGLPQRYGTQTVSSQLDGKESVCYIWPVENAAKLDSLRTSAHLVPMDKYVKLVGATYSTQVVWDPTKRIEDMPVKYPAE